MTKYDSPVALGHPLSSQQSVETQPGSSQFDGAAAYEAYLNEAPHWHGSNAPMPKQVITTTASMSAPLTNEQILSIAEKHHCLHPGVDEWWEFRDESDIIAFARAILQFHKGDQK